jgi:hypothetical protein
LFYEKNDNYKWGTNNFREAYQAPINYVIPTYKIGGSYI